MREFEIRNNNKILIDKIRTINNIKPQCIVFNKSVKIQKQKSLSNLKVTTLKNHNKKWEIFKIAKENQVI